nr:hypothetical protein [Tanacetum cinerariifolium]
MSRDVLTIGSTMTIPLLYQGEYSQWFERFMNYLEEQTDGEAMINSIKNGDQPLPRITQVSIAKTTSTKQPPLKDISMCNKTAKDLWDALKRNMFGSEYGEQDRKAAVLYECETYGMLWQGIIPRECIQTGGKIAKLDADENVILIDVNTAVEIDADTQGMMKEDVTASKEINATEPTVFDDEEVTMTMAQTLIKMKAKKQRILDEQMAKRLQDVEIKQVAAREKQEKEDLERAKVLQQLYDQKQENIDWNVVAE